MTSQNANIAMTRGGLMFEGLQRNHTCETKRKIVRRQKITALLLLLCFVLSSFSLWGLSRSLPPEHGGAHPLSVALRFAAMAAE